MQYSQKDIAKRITHERESVKMTMGELSEKLNINRNTLSAWESTDKTKGRMPPLDDLLNMCNLFNCELTYLLCQHDTKTRDNADVQKVTGLSEKAIDHLAKMRRSPFTEGVSVIINYLLTNDDFSDFVNMLYKSYRLSRYIESWKESDLINKDFADLADVKPIDIQRGYDIAIRDIAAKIQSNFIESQLFDMDKLLKEDENRRIMRKVLIKVSEKNG